MSESKKVVLMQDLSNSKDTIKFIQEIAREYKKQEDIRSSANAALGELRAKVKARGLDVAGWKDAWKASKSTKPAQDEYHSTVALSKEAIDAIQGELFGKE